MKTSRKCLLAALVFLVLALVSFLFSKETIRGILRQKADEQAADAYVASAAALHEEVSEKTAKETEYSTESKTIESVVSESEERMEKERDTSSETITAKPEKPSETTETLSEETLTVTHTETPETIRETFFETTVPPTTGFPNEPSYVPVEDEAYLKRRGVTYTPEYAVGRIDCVLEIPKISLKRCVYSGTDEEINADLDMWFTVAASGDLVPGETHYAIFGHNHTVQNLSFNRLGELTIGDWFTLTREGSVYIYIVTDIFAAERAAGRAAYAYDDSLDPSLCYIFTCGRDYMLLNGVSTRYKDYIVEGTMWRTVPVSVWQGTEERGAAEGKKVRAAAAGSFFVGRGFAVPEKTSAEEPSAEETSAKEDLLEALSQAAEEVRQAKPAPVLTLTQEGSLYSDGSSFSPPSFSWSMLLVILTGIFAGISAILFLICFFLKATAAP